MCLVGYTYRGYEMEYTFQKAREYDFDCVEIRDFSDINFSNVDSIKRSIEKAKKMSSKYDLETSTIFLPIGDSYKEKEILQLLPFLAKNNISILHTHVSLTKGLVSAKAHEKDYLAAAKMLKNVGKEAQKQGVTIAIESHMGTIHDTSTSLMKILECTECKAVKASLDFANLIIVNRNEDLIKTIRKLNGKIGYTHIKNCKLYSWGSDWGVALQYGDINYYKILKELIDNGYNGLFATEFCGSGDPDVFARIDGAYLRELLNGFA